MKRNGFLQLFVTLALVIFCSTSKASTGCIQTHVDRSYFADSDEVRGYLVPTLESNCSAERATYKVHRYDSGAGLFVQIDEQSAEIPTTGRVRRESPAFRLKGLDPGLYRVDSYAADLQESLLFTVGAYQGRESFPVLGIDSRFNMDRLPYVKPAAVTSRGWMYFRGSLTEGSSAHLYQVRPDRTEILSVTIEQIDPQDKSIFTNMPHVRGGALDLPWMRVKLVNNSFDSGRPVFIVITTGESLTINGMAYDPGDPSRFFNGFAVNGGSGK